MAQQITKEERSLGELFSELASETSTLVKQEVSLATTEMTLKATKVGKNVGFLAAGGAVGYTALLVILAAIVIGLTQLLSNLMGWQLITSAWVAAAIVGVVVGIIAYFLVTSALAKLKTIELTPQQTVETIKEDAQCLKDKEG